jgi:hypothetical protein
MAYTAINNSTDYFRTKLYTGNGSVRSITFDESSNMQPDLMWVKSRTTTASWLSNDAVRGATKRLKLDLTTAESTETGMITSFDTNGFSLGTTSTSNANAETFASYSWKANGSGSSNSDGSITSTVSVDTTAGFSIVKWSGSGSNATIGHGLGVAPKMIITKSLGTSAWAVYNENLGNTNVMFLDTSATTTANVAYWNNTSPTSTVFSVGTDDSVNHSGNDMIAYCFAEKIGYSRFGSYRGNGNADGSFVYTGFKPTWMVVKHASGGTAGGEHWNLQDVKRSPYNTSIIMLSPNETSTDNSTTNNSIDILSNGFKIRTVDGRLNNAGATYIYMAFGQTVVGSNNIPCTAR